MWIGAQAALALFRITFWLCDPSFDDPKVEDPRIAPIAKNYADKFAPMTFVRKLPTQAEQRIPLWAWDFLSKTSVTEIIRQAREQDAFSVYENTEKIFVLGMDPSDLFSDLRRDSAFLLERPFKWRIFLHLDHGKKVSPIIYVHRESWVQLSPELGNQREDTSFWTPLERALGSEPISEQLLSKGRKLMIRSPYLFRMYFHRFEIDGIGDLSFGQQRGDRFYHWGFKSHLLQPEMALTLANFAAEVYNLKEYPGKKSMMFLFMDPLQ